MFQMLRSAFIHLHLLIFGVITTINLYYKTFLYAYKVNDIITHYMLPIKLKPQVPASQIFPKQFFGFCRILLIFLSEFP